MVLKALLMNSTTLINVTNLDNIKKQRHHFADKGPYSQSYGFCSSQEQIWKLDHKEGWMMLLNCGEGEDSWESLRQQGDQASQS